MRQPQTAERKAIAEGSTAGALQDHIPFPLPRSRQMARQQQMTAKAIALHLPRVTKETAQVSKATFWQTSLAQDKRQLPPVLISTGSV